MTEIVPTAPAPAEAAKVPALELPKPEASPPPAADPAKDQKQAESDKSAPSEPPKPDTPDDKAARKSTRYDELYARSKESEARAVIAERRAERIEKELTELRHRFDTMPVEQQDFARMQAAVKQESLATLKADAEDAKQQAAQAMADAFKAKVDDRIDRMPGFWEKFNNIPLSEHAAELVAASDLGPEVGYFLASNPAQAQRIAGLPPHRQGAEIARIEARLAPAASMRRASQAPAPVPTLSGGGSSPAIKSPQEMSTAEFVTWFQKTGGR